jgi:hypothetical protein
MHYIQHLSLYYIVYLLIAPALTNGQRNLKELANDAYDGLTGGGIGPVI